eukprot:COSAG02_NODE_24458_length_687_cov_1.323129_2_plen_63_part_01
MGPRSRPNESNAIEFTKPCVVAMQIRPSSTIVRQHAVVDRLDYRGSCGDITADLAPRTLVEGS